MNTVKKLAEILLEKRMLLFGSFTLSSGIKSFYYIDLKKLPSYPIFRTVIEDMIKAVKGIDYDIVIGIATGGIPIASYISCLTGKSMGYVRLDRKGYGTNKRIEGEVYGKKILLVDDVATTGSSLETSINILIDSGGSISASTVIVDRCEGASSRLRSIGVKYIPLYRVSDLFRYIIDHEDVAENFKNLINNLLADGCGE